MGQAKSRGSFEQRKKQAEEVEKALVQEIAQLDEAQALLNVKKQGYIEDMVKSYFKQVDAEKFGVPVDYTPS